MILVTRAVALVLRCSSRSLALLFVVCVDFCIIDTARAVIFVIKTTSTLILGLRCFKRRSLPCGNSSDSGTGRGPAWERAARGVKVDVADLRNDHRETTDRCSSSSP